MGGDEGLIGAHGGYRGLKSYRGAEIVYDATVAFCGRFVDRFSRTRDQMVQAEVGAFTANGSSGMGGYNPRIFFGGFLVGYV
jgi:hypothetical protein